MPRITRPAPAHAPAAGLCFVVSHRMGSTMAGEVADRVETMPVLPPDNANSKSVMPMPMAKMPESTVRAAIFHVNGCFCWIEGIGANIKALRQTPAMPTRNMEATNGSIPDAISGLAIIDPMACPNAAPSPSATPTHKVPFTCSSV